MGIIAEPIATILSDKKVLHFSDVPTGL